MSLSDVDVTERVRRLIADADLEVIPMKGAAEKLIGVPASTPLTITCSPKLGLERTLEYTALAIGEGHEVVPHLAARQVHGETELTDIVGRLQEVGVSRVYVIGGDADQPVGPYVDAGDLLEGLSHVGHAMRVGVSCYPEGHPKITDEALFAALERKQALADYMVSQMCFDVAAITTWLRTMRDNGINLPLKLGLAGPLQLRRLAELSLRIGVGQSLRFLTKQHGLLSTILKGETYQPQEVLTDMGEDLLSPDLDVEGLHVFTFNQISECLAWQQQVVG